MAFPTVEHCLVCEDVRPEATGKSTIIGFYGLLPGVELFVADASKRIDRLGFMLICGAGGAGTYKINPQVTGPQGQNLAQNPEIGPLILPDAPVKHIIVLGFAPLQLAGAGEYTFLLQVDGSTVFSGTFRVRQGVAPTG